MDTYRNLLFGALALQTGLIDSYQFTESCQHWSERLDKSFEDILVEDGWVSRDDTAHLEHLLQTALSRHRGDAKAALNALPSFLRRSLATLEALDCRDTVASSTPPPGAGTPGTPISLPSAETRYTFLSLHASGGIGRVWLARDRQLDREVAIKELRPEQAGDPNVATRFLREARLTGQLEHPGIVPVYELTSRPDTNTAFYAMRLVRGRTLTSAIEAYHAKRVEGRAEPLEFVALLSAFTAVCNTIAYAHSHGVLHRDLKGDNVILGDFGEVIVVDWGLAKVMGQDETDTIHAGPGAVVDAGLTIQGEIMGTPAYMSPEQAEGRLDQIDQRTDIYGLGAMLYEILTGQPPFAGPTTQEILHQAVRGSPLPPHEVWPEVPAVLEEVCLRAMAKDANERYAAAADLAQEVQRWQDVQRRQAEDALRRQTEVLHSILNGMSEGVIVADADGSLILINSPAERMIGRSAEATLAATHKTSKFYHADTVTPLSVDDLPSSRAIRGEDVDDAEMFLRPVHGGPGIWVSANARPLRDQSGGIRGGVVVFRDITERKRAEEGLRASEAQYRTLADLIPGIVWSSRPDGWIDYANQYWLKFTGLTMQQTEGSGWTVAVHPDDLDSLTQIWSKALQTGEAVEAEYRVKRAADGEYRWFLAQGRPVRDGDGRIVKWFGMLTEIEDHKQGQNALQRENKLVRLLHQVTIAAYEAATVEEALQAALDLVCVHTGWPVGHVYIRASQTAQELIPAPIWHLARPKEFESFVQVTAATTLASGAGLPGRVLADKEPLWIMDVTQDDNFPRAQAAANLGVKGAFGFPVLTAAGVVAVLEFFTSEPKEPDEVLLRAMAQIGLELGQVFERKRTEAELQEVRKHTAGHR